MNQNPDEPLCPFFHPGTHLHISPLKLILGATMFTAHLHIRDMFYGVCVGACMFVCVGRIIHVFVFTTSGGKLLGVDDFGSIFLSRGDLHAPPDHRECTPGKKQLEQY